jgi:hypothetical protein
MSRNMLQDLYIEISTELNNLLVDIYLRREDFVPYGMIYLLTAIE